MIISKMEMNVARIAYGDAGAVAHMFMKMDAPTYVLDYVFYDITEGSFTKATAVGVYNPTDPLQREGRLPSGEAPPPAHPTMGQGLGNLATAAATRLAAPPTTTTYTEQDQFGPVDREISGRPGDRGHERKVRRRARNTVPFTQTGRPWQGHYEYGGQQIQPGWLDRAGKTLGAAAGQAIAPLAGAAKLPGKVKDWATGQWDDYKQHQDYKKNTRALHQLMSRLSPEQQQGMMEWGFPKWTGGKTRADMATSTDPTMRAVSENPPDAFGREGGDVASPLESALSSLVRPPGERPMTLEDTIEGLSEEDNTLLNELLDAHAQSPEGSEERTAVEGRIGDLIGSEGMEELDQRRGAEEGASEGRSSSVPQLRPGFATGKGPVGQEEVAEAQAEGRSVTKPPAATPPKTRAGVTSDQPEPEEGADADGDQTGPPGAAPEGELLPEEEAWRGAFHSAPGIEESYSAGTDPFGRYAWPLSEPDEAGKQSRVKGGIASKFIGGSHVPRQRATSGTGGKYTSGWEGQRGTSLANILSRVKQGQKEGEGLFINPETGEIDLERAQGIWDPARDQYVKDWRERMQEQYGVDEAGEERKFGIPRSLKFPSLLSALSTPDDTAWGSDHEDPFETEHDYTVNPATSYLQTHFPGLHGAGQEKFIDAQTAYLKNQEEAMIARKKLQDQAKADTEAKRQAGGTVETATGGPPHANEDLLSMARKRAGGIDENAIDQGVEAQHQANQEKLMTGWMEAIRDYPPIESATNLEEFIQGLKRLHEEVPEIQEELGTLSAEQIAELYKWGLDGVGKAFPSPLDMAWDSIKIPEGA